MQPEAFSRPVNRAALVFLAALLLAGLGLGSTFPARPAAAEPLPRLIGGPAVYFPGTGQTLGGPILRQWIAEFEAIGVGEPITPAVQLGDTVTQWTEFGRLEYRGPDFAAASPEEIVRAPVGWLYAEKLGYTRWVKAFEPVEAGGVETRYFYETRHSLANDFLRHYELRGNEEQLGAPISQEFSIGNVVYQFFEYGAMAWDTEQGTRIVPLGRLDAALYGYGTPPDDYRYGDVTFTSANLMALSDAFPGEQYIEVDLTTHEVVAWAGDVELLRTKVVTGPPQSPTPTGNFSIYIRYQVQDLSGIGWNGQPYYAPGTPWVMYFFEDYAIHGSTWRETYGFGSGQGCVIPPNEEAELLWKWADYGTRVWVHY